MNFQLIPPPVCLSAYVQSFWFYEDEGSIDRPYLYHSMADWHPELVFQYKGRFNIADSTTTLAPTFLYGQSNKVLKIASTEKFGLFGIYFYPFAIPLLFSIPADKLSAQLIDLHTLLGIDDCGLEERIMLAGNNAERISIMTVFLQKKIAQNQTQYVYMPGAVKQIVQAKGHVDIKGLASAHNLSHRQFERNFKVSAGFSPKLFSRIIRFQSALNEYKSKEKTLTQISYECGYYDQSHFIHDFKEFSGFHPKAFFSGKASGTELRANI